MATLAKKSKIVATPESLATGHALKAFQKAAPIFEKMPNAMVAGGFVRDMYDPLATPSRDVDLFFTEEDDMEKAAAFLASREFKIVRTSNFHRSFEKGDRSYDLVWDADFTSPEAILATFDFRCCQVGLTRDTFYHADKFEQDIADRALVLSTPERAPFCLYHLAKMANRGWTLSRDEARRIAKAICEYTTDEDGKRMRQS